MRSVNTAQVNQLREHNVDIAVVNVLSAEDFRQRHIPGSVNVPLFEPEFVEKMETAIGGREKPVIVYCASQTCEASEKAARALDEAGFQEVYDYVGGLEEWQESGNSVQAGPPFV